MIRDLVETPWSFEASSRWWKVQGKKQSLDFKSTLKNIYILEFDQGAICHSLVATWMTVRIISTCWRKTTKQHKNTACIWNINITTFISEYRQKVKIGFRKREIQEKLEPNHERIVQRTCAEVFQSLLYHLGLSLADQIKNWDFRETSEIQISFWLWFKTFWISNYPGYKVHNF